MNTKLKSFFVLLLVLGGVKVSWADITHEIKFKSRDHIEASPNDSYFVYNKGEGTEVKWSSEGKHSCTYNGETYSDVIKMESATQIIFETSSANSTVTIVQTTSDEGGDKLKFNGVNLNSSMSNTTVTVDETNKCNIYVITNVGKGKYKITRQSETGLAYVKVVEGDPTTTINIEDLCYEHYYFGSDLARQVAGINITATEGIYSYNSNGTYKLVVPNGQYIQVGLNSANNSTAKIKNVRLILENNSTIDVPNTSEAINVQCTNTSGVDQGVIGIVVTTDTPLTWSKGTPTITFSPASVTYNVSQAGVEQDLGDLNSGTLQTTPKAFRLDYNITNNGSGSTAMYHLSGKNLGVTPGLTKANEVLTASFAGNDFFNAASATLNIKITDGSYESEYIVTDKATIDGSERNLQGKFTFTGEGSISGGTVVDDVPGISMTVGAEGNDNWTVVDALAIDGSYPLGSAAAYCPTGANRPTNTTGCFFKFEPVVNGELIVRYYATKEVYWGTQGETGSRQEGTRIQTKTFLVKAGEKYYLAAKEEGFYLNSFSFRPMFFLVDQSTGTLTTTEASKDSNSPFTANMTTAVDRFPHLITAAAGEGIVKFAGDRAVVNLATNNDVTLVGDGSSIIKGTVLHENNVDDLFAYYYLQSNILTLDGTYRLENDGSTPTAIADQAYVTQDELQNGQYQFDFSHNIAATSNYKVYFKRIGIDTGEIDLTTFNDVGNLEISGDKLIVKLNGLDKGRTYKIRIPSGSVQHSEDNNVQNAEIIRYFTVKADGEAQVTMIYPSGVATVATSIVLQAATSAGSTECNVVKESPVVGMLTAANGTSMTITATLDQNKLVFKPSTALSPNTTYTLSVTANQIKIDTDPNEVVTKDKEFVFTTGAAAGTVPQIVSTSPAQGDVVTARTGTISFVFDQEIDLEPYSHVLATPVNGSEATASGHSGAPGAEQRSLNKISSNTISFDYSADQLKYDLYYNLVFPANTITGAGGKANSEPITVRFKVAKNPSATEVDASSFYPHTWDFNKFGDSAVEGSTAYNIVNNCGKPSSSEKYVNSLYSGTEDSYTTYKTKPESGYGFDQGNNVYFNNKSGETEVMDEFEGIRISLVDTRSNRFEIRNVTSKETSNKNEDRTDKWIFRMNGNTHYMTLSNVPVGKLYMVANSKHIGINSPNATFESVSGSGYTLSNGNTILSTNGVKKIVINVATAGDVSFCVQDFNCEKIGVAVDEKTYNPNFVKDGKTYATDRLGYDVRYDLLNAFTEHAAKTYYVSNLADNASDNTATITATEISNHVAKANEGTLVVYQGAVDVATTVPVFKTDVNTASVEATNSLKVIETGSTSLPSITDGYYMYVLSYRGTKSTGVNFYRYTGSSFSDRAAYLEIPKSWVEPTEPGQGARLLRMVFIDEDGNQTTHIRDLEIAGVSEIDQASGAYYNLRGQRVKTPTTSGLYIRNGKKVYVVK